MLKAILPSLPRAVVRNI